MRRVIRVVKEIDEWTHAHEVLARTMQKGTALPLPRLQRRWGTRRIVPVEGAGVDDEPGVRVDGSLPMCRRDVGSTCLDEGPVVLEFMALFLEQC